MTITAPSASISTDFSIGGGRPSRIRTHSRADLRDIETALVETLGHYTVALAAHCQHHDPTEFAYFIQDLFDVNPADAPPGWSTRIAGLLHSYADYMPSGECEFIDLGTLDFHAWAAPDGLIVVDVVTTLAMTELDPAGEAHKVANIKRSFGCALGGTFAGVPCASG